MKLASLLTTTLLFTWVLPLSAQPRVFHCGTYTQDKPCTVRVKRKIEISSMRAAPAPALITNAAIDAPAASGSARVLEQSFKRLTGSDGLWSGRVEGTGKINLELQILRNGALESRRYMGNIELVNTSSGFKFRSVIPKGSDWEWRVVAFNS